MIKGKNNESSYEQYKNYRQKIKRRFWNNRQNMISNQDNISYDLYRKRAKRVCRHEISLSGAQRPDMLLICCTPACQHDQTLNLKKRTSPS